MDTTILEDLGLSKGEIKTYLTLLELGPTKVGKIIEKSGLASSAVHNALHALLDKGLISYIKKGKINYYQSAAPHQIVDFIEDKKKKVLQLLPELELKQKLAEEKEEAEIFIGLSGIISMLNELIADTQKGDSYYFFATSLENRNEEIQKFFRLFDIKRKEKGLNVKGLALSGLRHLFQGRPVLKMKYPSFPIPSDISICNHKVALISWSEKPVGYLLNSQQMYSKYEEFFLEVWNRS